jgi:hypothetical protein
VLVIIFRWEKSKNQCLNIQKKPKGLKNTKIGQKNKPFKMQKIGIKIYSNPKNLN